jgi:ATP-dependent HslUV protease subunit HslV
MSPFASIALQDVFAPSIAVYTVSSSPRPETKQGLWTLCVTLEFHHKMKQRIRSTTVLCVRRDGKVVMAGDGQVTLGSEVLKSTARKLRRLYSDKIVAGFAGSTADAFSLFARFEAKLEQFNGNLPRAVVELAKDWRTDKILRHLEALLLVADVKNTFILSGNGDVIEPDEDVAAIGSGGPFALSAATALMHHTKLNARQISEEAMKIAGKTCIYTNDHVIFEELN